MMEPDLKYLLEEMSGKIDTCLRDTDKIKRGLYGDDENNQEGLIQKHSKHDERIRKIETTHKRVAWWGGGFLVAVELVWHTIKDFFK